MSSVVEALVPGGKANPGPPLGPALGPLGVNIKEVVDTINEKTSDYNGMQVPVKVIVGDDKSVDIEVGTPPTAALVLQEAGVGKGAGEEGNSEIVGNLSITQLAKIARMKKDDLLSYEMKAGIKEVLGTCVPMGITGEGMKPQDCQKAIDEGKFDEALASEAW
ncbi:50S ribosomal protein L11 [Methanohalophilus sp.]